MKDVDKDNDNVLHFANMKDFPHGCHVETLRFLVGCMQVDINAQNRLGDTPLMLAVRYDISTRDSLFPLPLPLLSLSSLSVSVYRPSRVQVHLTPSFTIFTF